MAILVKNLKGTSGKKLPSGYYRWLDFWERKKRWTPGYCRNIACTRSAEKGGHIIVGNTDKKEYIVPICSSCNNEHDKEFYVNESDLVPVHD